MILFERTEQRLGVTKNIFHFIYKILFFFFLLYLALLFFFFFFNSPEEDQEKKKKSRKIFLKERRQEKESNWWSTSSSFRVSDYCVEHSHTTLSKIVDYVTHKTVAFCREPLYLQGNLRHRNVCSTIVINKLEPMRFLGDRDWRGVWEKKKKKKKVGGKKKKNVEM